jgi:hypothetical protein
MAITNLGFSVGPGLIAPIKESYGWEFTILVFAIVVSGVLFILQFMRTKVHMHQLEDLEKQDMLIHESVFRYPAT